MPGVYPGTRKASSDGRAGSDELLALHVLSEPRAELGTEVVTLGTELDRRLQVVEGIPDVEAPALEAVGVDRLLLRQQVDRIRELDLASAARRGPSQRVEDLRREHVSADHGEVGRRLLRRRLLDDRQDPDQILLERLRLDASVHGDLLLADLHRRDDAPAEGVVRPEHLAQERFRGMDQVIAEHDHEGLVADVRLCDRHRVSEPEGFLLMDVVDIRHVRNLPDPLELVELLLVLEESLEFEVTVEVVLDRALAAPGHDQDVVDTRSSRFLDDELDRGDVDHGEHDLRLRLGGRKEPGAHPGSRDHRLANLHEPPRSADRERYAPFRRCANRHMSIGWSADREGVGTLASPCPPTNTRVAIAATRSTSSRRWRTTRSRSARAAGGGFGRSSRRRRSP